MPPRKRQRREPSLHGPLTRGGKFRARDDPAWMAQQRLQTRTRAKRSTSDELKYLDCAWNGVALGTAVDASSAEVMPSSGCTDCISVPAQGDTEIQRDGRKYTLKSVWLSGTLDSSALPDQADAIEDRGCYFALVLDTQTNGAAVNSEDVFINPGTSTANLVPQPLRNLKNSKRFRILDSVYVPPGGMYAFTDGTATGSCGNQIAPVINLSWKGSIVCDSKNTTANVTSASDNSISLIAYNAGGTTKVFYGKSRVRFTG